MKEIFVSGLVALAALSPVSCTVAAPVESEFCVLAGDSWEDIDEVVSLMDPFATANGYVRGEKGPHGLRYANKRKSPDWLLSISSVGPIGVEIAFFPRQTGGFEAERAAIQNHVEENIPDAMNLVPCDQKEAYGKGVIYGFDAIRL
jgi:hypothetical protein